MPLPVHVEAYVKTLLPATQRQLTVILTTSLTCVSLHQSVPHVFQFLHTCFELLLASSNGHGRSGSVSDPRGIKYSPSVNGSGRRLTAGRLLEFERNKSNMAVSSLLKVNWYTGSRTYLRLLTPSRSNAAKFLPVLFVAVYKIFATHAGCVIWNEKEQ